MHDQVELCLMQSLYLFTQQILSHQSIKNIISKYSHLNVAIYFKKSFILLIYRQYKKMLMMLLI